MQNFKNTEVLMILLVCEILQLLQDLMTYM